MSFRTHSRGRETPMRNAFQALRSCGWKAGFRRWTSNGDTAQKPASFQKALPTAYCNDSIVPLRYKRLWPILLLHQSQGPSKSLSIARGELHGRKSIESLEVLSEMRVGRTRSANAVQAWAMAGLQSLLDGHMQIRRTKISGCGVSYCPRASLSTQCAWDRSGQHTRTGLTMPCS
jgi:hypothetical protein